MLPLLRGTRIIKFWVVLVSKSRMKLRHDCTELINLQIDKIIRNFQVVFKSHSLCVTLYITIDMQHIWLHGFLSPGIRMNASGAIVPLLILTPGYNVCVPYSFSHLETNWFPVQPSARISLFLSFKPWLSHNPFKRNPLLGLDTEYWGRKGQPHNSWILIFSSEPPQNAHYSFH